MSSSRHARITRIAISPRLAIRSFSKNFIGPPAGHRRSGQHRRYLQKSRYLAVHRAVDRVLHLHRFEDDEVSPFFTGAPAHEHLQYHSLHVALDPDRRYLPLGFLWNTCATTLLPPTDTILTEKTSPSTSTSIWSGIPRPICWLGGCYFPVIPSGCVRL